MKTFISLLLSLSFSTIALSQDCNCPEQFDFLTRKITANYSGFKDKVRPSTRNEYELFTAKYRKLTDATKVDSTCFRLLNEWAAWFEDGHIQLGNASGDDPVEIRARFEDWETIATTENEVKTYLSNSSDALEGIWENDSGQYKCAIIKNQNEHRDYVAFILKADSIWWMPGHVKFELKESDISGEYQLNYYMRDHSLRTPKAWLKNKQIDVEGLGSWWKVYPGMPAVRAKEDNKMYSLESLDDETLLLTIPTMNNNYQKEMRQLVKANKKLLKTTPNLIIDCRNNGGGSDLTYFPLRPFIYTQPVTAYHGQVYSTTDNNKAYKGFSEDKDFSLPVRMYYKMQYRKLNRKVGKYVGKTGTFKRKLIRKYANPKKVVVLINGGCASSCEQFALYCEQSKRTTLMGEATAGILDYGNLNELKFPNGKWGLFYPTTRSSRVDVGKGIDNIGVQPDVELDESTEDWIECARQYIKSE